ncbi:Malate synthase [Nymphaea thermarum]|nr:Malate synthase [Nymphaea thermarum]
MENCRNYDVPHGVEIRGHYDDAYASILSKEALQFLADLHREFRQPVKYIMECRKQAKERYNSGDLPVFDPASRWIREGSWVCAPIPSVVADRRVEITGPVERKMIINALNSGAKVFMADFEDSLSPTWDNLMKGQVNLKDAVNGTINFHDAQRNRLYILNEERAVLFVRTRAWHLPEAHTLIDNEPATGCLSVFERAEEVAHIPRGSIKATVLIETLPAVFQMDEILYELREHSLGLNCGRWDYIFSYVKTFQEHPDRLLPDRVQVGMTQHLMKSYSDLLIYTCHRRGVHAMGGMAAQIPIKDDDVANEAALELVFKDKSREVHAGHDGTWAAHPGLIQLVMEVFNNNMKNGPNQIEIKKREDSTGITEDDLLQRPRGTQTVDALRLNVRVGIQYLEAWLSGTGSVPLYHLMEDAATAEICRVQNWQWIKHGAVLEGEGGIKLKATMELFERVVKEEMARIEREVGHKRFAEGMFRKACNIFTRQCTTPTLDDFLTLEAYNQIVQFHPDACSKL